MIVKIYSVCVMFFLICLSSFAQVTAPTNANVNVNNVDFTADEGYLGARAKGKYSVWYGCNHTKVEKPFIYIEGIDLTPSNTYKSNEPPTNTYSDSLYLPLMEDGFDIVQLDFNTNPAYIQRNAELLITLINQLNVEMGDNGQEIVVMGESMGGMIARYALTKMEDDGVDHNVRLYISHDSQHSGATVPWGIQYMLQDLTNNGLTNLFVGSAVLSGITNTFAGLFGGSGTSSHQAVFQLLRSSPNALAVTTRAQFVTDLQNKGDYPNDCRMIAIANGANNGTPQANPNAANQLIRMTLPNATIAVDRRAYASPGIQIAGLGTRIVYTKLSGSVINSSIRFYPPGLQNRDVAPGGYFFENTQFGVLATNRFSFCPTITALGLNTNDPFYNVATNIAGFDNTIIPDYDFQYNQRRMVNTGYTHSNAISEFDAVWADAANDYHATLEGVNFLLQEISPSTLVIQNRIINDAKIFEAEDVVIIGENESAAFPVGNVVFENGSNVTVRSDEEIIWRDGFEIEAGANANFLIEYYNCP